MRYVNLAVCGVLVAGLVVCDGCRRAGKSLSERIAEKAIEAQNGGKASVDIQSGKMTIKTKDGTAEFSGGGGAKVPADFPADVALPKGGNVVMSMHQQNSYVVTMEVSQAMEKTYETLAAQMKEQGWSEDATVNLAEARTGSFKKASRQAQIMVAKTDKGSTVSVTVTDSKG